MDAGNQSQFAKNMRKYRTIKEWTQEKLASEAGLSVNYISELKIGKGKPSFEAVKAIANALGVSLDRIAYDYEAPSEDFFAQELMNLRSNMSDKKRKTADYLGLKLYEDISNMPDD